MDARQRKTRIIVCLCVFAVTMLILVSTPRLAEAQFEASGGLGRIVHAPLSGLSLQSNSDWNDKYSTGMIAALPSLADLAGTWNISTLASGPGAPYWFRGRITANPDGSWSGTGQDYGEPPGSVSGSFVISADGTITIIVSNAAQCQMGAGKTVLVCTETWIQGEPGTSNLIILTKFLYL
jgi:hypothetical protein